jgi:hypothetical protein
LVKKRGNGVGVASMVAVGSGVLVKGTGVWEGGIVAVEIGIRASVGVAGWQAAVIMKNRHAMGRFFMMPIKTQLPGTWFQAVTFCRHDTNRTLEHR